MKQQNPWLVSERRMLREAFKANPNVSPAELCALIPRHSWSGIKNKVLELGIDRGDIGSRHRSGWAKIVKALELGMKTRQEIALAIGCTEGNVRVTLLSMKGHWHVGGWRETYADSAKAQLIALGAGKDVPYPRKPRKSRAKPGRKNPFLVAAGAVAAPSGIQGRVFVHLYDDEEMAA